jgi:flavin reductase (DIM6/NTAB) family NADH-FMN oxidoreductase RutF
MSAAALPDQARPDEAFDPRALRAALGRFPTGVCLVTTRTPGAKREGMTINSFASVSLDPPLVLWSIANDARSAEVFLGATHFNISVLGAGHKALAQHFARPAPDKFEAFEAAFVEAENGVPRLAHAPATWECAVHARHAEGDHTILIGRVLRFDDFPGEPLLFHAGRLDSLAGHAQGLASSL